MKNLIYLIAILLILSCEKSENESIKSIEFEEIELECINGTSRCSGSLAVRIDTQEEYDSLYYYDFTKILDDWLSNNYSSLISGVIKNFPGASPEDYDSILINDYVYNFLPFKWIKDCTHPSVDFNNYTLLGQSVSASGCSTPTLETVVYINKSKKELTFLTRVETYGNCEMGFGFCVWILVDKLADDYEIAFKLEEKNNP